MCPRHRALDEGKEARHAGSCAFLTTVAFLVIIGPIAAEAQVVTEPGG